MECFFIENMSQTMTEVNTFQCFEKDRDNDLSNYFEKKNKSKKKETGERGME